MHKLLEFLRTNVHWLIFILLQTAALLMLFNSSIYHRSLKLMATNYVVGNISSSLTEVYSYMNLREQNEALLHENARLERDYLSLVRKVEDAEADTVRPIVHVKDSLSDTLPEYSYTTARIISIKNHNSNVYYIINKGSKDHLHADMPVMSSHGVVGTITEASANYAIVIPLLNPKMKLSCSIKGKGYYGSMLWDKPGGEYATLGDLPLHAEIAPGDTVVTSGFSYIFPQNLMVGVVAQDPKRKPKEGKSFSNYSVKLATDFNKLSYVYVINNIESTEVKKLEGDIKDVQ